MRRLLIVANRLPVKVQIDKNKVNYTASAGGLATGLNSLEVAYEKHWIGWPGTTTKNPKQQQKIRDTLVDDNIHPIFLDKKDLGLYYYGFSNKVIWPMFHYFSEFVSFNQEYWDQYLKVNERFAQHVLDVAREDDIIWVQDYHLMLLPAMLREKLPKAEIGFFLHIPFPSYELFRTLPWRNAILNGLLGADLIGFHTFGYMRHFMSAAYRITGFEPKLGVFELDNRTVQVETFPMGINYEQFNEAVKSDKVKSQIVKFRERFSDSKLIISVDRLDYSKGIPQKLKAYDRFLEKNPEYREAVSLLIVLVPSRDVVDQYEILKEEIDEMVGNINGKYATLNWSPIHYFYRSIPFEQLAALYNLADIALVTPLRDGMNLVAKEYIASKADRRGVLILSEMAGASIELTEAILINPNDILSIEEALKTALHMPLSEQKLRNRYMQQVIKRQNVKKWANNFMVMLDKKHLNQVQWEEKRMTKKEQQHVFKSFENSRKRLFVLDYEGTLIPYAEAPENAFPDDDLILMLQKLSAYPQTNIVITSGMDYEILGEWFEDVDISILAENGNWLRENSEWKNVFKESDDWKKDIYPIMQRFVDKTPKSFIEEKTNALVFHYRKTDAWLADIRSRELMNSLVYPCTRNNLEILDGQKVIEVKNYAINKGKAIKNHFLVKRPDFIMAIGDDRTDEEVFTVLPDNSFTIRVGLQTSSANYHFSNWKDARQLLSLIVENSQVPG